MDLRLCGDLLLRLSRRNVQWERDDVLVLVIRLRRIRDVVFEQTSLEAGRVIRSTFLIERGLHEGEELFAGARDGEAFEALIVVAAGRCIGWGNGFVQIIDWGGVGGKGEGVVAVGEVGRRGLDCEFHFARAGEFVDVGAVFVGNEEAAVRGEDEAFAVDRDAFAAGPGAAEAVAFVGGDWKLGEAGVGYRARDVGIKARGWGAVGAGEEDGVLVGELEIWGGRMLCGGGVGEGEGECKFVDAVLVVQSAFGIPAAVRKGVYDAFVAAFGRFLPALTVDSCSGPIAAESVAVFVSCI